ncbi:MAG: discoidin domain-containing protein [Deltaproteobacteria bacterium]|nr:discoidin domain-containing protein [Deltaproteobacteria bacterium]
MSIVAGVREWFLLRDLEARAAKVRDDIRAERGRSLRLSQQRRAAAEALWIAGHPAEALHLLRAAVELARSATEEGEPLVAPELPAFDAEVKAADAARFRALLAEHAQLFERHAELRLAPRDVVERRVVRLAGTALVLLLSIVAIVLLARTPRRLEASASAKWDARYDPANAVDGNDKTDWLLPDHAQGWLDVKVIPPRKIARVKLMNARNLPWNDRASNELSIEAFDGAHVVKTATTKFDGVSPDPAWRTVEIGAKVDRLRVHVKSSHAQGGGVSEVIVE